MTLDGIVTHFHTWTPLVSLHRQNVGFKYYIDKFMYMVFCLMGGEHNP